MRSLNSYSICFVLLFLCLLTQSCASYKQNLLFRPDESFNNDAFKKYMQEAEKEYKIQKFDYLAIEIFTNCGERIVDPNDEIDENKDRERGSGANNQMVRSTNPANLGNYLDPTGLGRFANMRKYFVNTKGSVNLPKVGEVTLEGLTLQEATQLLEQLLAAYYVNPFVTLRYTNKRVVILGALGNKILPLDNENMNLIEVLALAGNLTDEARANKIRLIRNISDGKPEMQEIDLTTFAGLKSAELIIMPNDILYIEPRRRPFKELLNDFGAFSGVLSSSVTLILTTFFIIDRLGNK